MGLDDRDYMRERAKARLHQDEPAGFELYPAQPRVL